MTAVLSPKHRERIEMFTALRNEAVYNSLSIYANFLRDFDLPEESISKAIDRQRRYLEQEATRSEVAEFVSFMLSTPHSKDQIEQFENMDLIYRALLEVLGDPSVK